MNVLFVIENYLPHIGGVEAVFKNLAEGLAAAGHQVTIITHQLKGASRYEVMNGVVVKRIPCFQSRYAFSFLAIPAAIYEALKADIIHTTTFNGALPAWIAAKLTFRKCVITVHEVWVGKWKEYTTMGGFSAALHEFLERLIYLLPFDKYVGVSQSTRKQLLAIGKKPEKTVTVYNALDYELFNPLKHKGRAVRKKLGLQKNFVCMTYGRPGASKGIEYTIEACARLKIPNVKYVLILSKDRQYQAQLLQIGQLIQKLGIIERVTMLGPVGRRELPSYIAAANCVVVPSLSEGFGYTAAEACAMGVPVVATNTTSLPEIVCGKFVLVEPRSSQSIADGIEAVYKGKYKKTPLRKFMLKDNVDGYLNVYKELVD